MIDLIDRKALLDSCEMIDILDENENIVEYAVTESVIKAVPMVDAALVVHAKWIVEYHEGAGVEWCCSNCAAVDKNEGSNFCPNCGAKMDDNTKAG